MCCKDTGFGEVIFISFVLKYECYSDGKVLVFTVKNFEYEETSEPK